MIQIWFLRIILGLLVTSNAHAASAQYVPPELWARIQNIVKHGVPFVDAKSTLCFPSAESSFGLGVVKNCIYRINDGRNTLWMMRQDIKSSVQNTENLVAIYVDAGTGKKNPMSYYLELDRPRFDENAEVAAVPYKVPCFMCHASGPRAIRPSADHLRRIPDDQKKLLNDWNRDLASYKISDQYTPAGKKGLALNLKTERGDEILRLQSCAECHNTTTGVRAPITRMHAATVYYLAFGSEEEFGHGFMPSYGASRLAPAERTCLQEWILGKRADGCAHVETDLKPATSVSDKKITDASRSFVFDETASTLTTDIHTTLHDFTVKQMIVSGYGKKTQDGSYLIACDIRLAALNAGISARSTHIKELLDVSQYPVIHLSGQAKRLGDQIWMPEALITLKGVTRSMGVKLTCDRALRSCRLLPMRLDLTDWGLAMPSFLGIQVSPTVDVQGTFTLTSGEGSADSTHF